jgi:hypothetical protein
VKTYGQERTRPRHRFSGPRYRGRIPASYLVLRQVRCDNSCTPERRLKVSQLTLSSNNPASSLVLSMAQSVRHLRACMGSKSASCTSFEATLTQAGATWVSRTTFENDWRRTFDIPADFWSVRTSHLAEGRNDQGGAAARLSVQVADWLTLTSLTAYRNADLRIFVDSDTTERGVATARAPPAAAGLAGADVDGSHRATHLDQRCVLVR